MTLTKHTEHSMAAGQAGANNIMAVSHSDLVAAVQAEIADYFSCPSVSGLTLSQQEIDYIAGGIVRRLSDS